jgi:hypothetical protein
MIALAATVLAAAAPVAGIRWDASYEAALERARAEGKVLFVAVNMDGEPANDRLAGLYRDARLASAAAATVNVVASRFEHAADGKPCARFEGLQCMDHRRCDSAVRASLIKADEQGYVVAPQHVFLSSDGAVILSVPYEVTLDELEWCFAEARRTLDPAVKAPPGARPPRRLIRGGVFDPSVLPGANLAPPTREELDQLLKELKAGLWGPGREQKVLRVLMSEEKDAIEWTAAELKIDWFGRRGFMREDPTGSGMEDRQDRLMHAIGVFSPKVYWKVVVDYVDYDDEKLRSEAAVALEQLAAPESTKALLAALPKEKSPAVRADLYRATGSAGAADEKARKALLKAAAGEKDAHARRNAIVALGWLAPNAEVGLELAKRLGDGVPEERAAAAIAMGLTRDAAWTEALEKATAEGADPAVKPHAERALQVVRGASLATLRQSLIDVAGQKIERERFFGGTLPGAGR